MYEVIDNNKITRNCFSGEVEILCFVSKPILFSSRLSDK